jgi:hypothetical protein
MSLIISYYALCACESYNSGDFSVTCSDEYTEEVGTYHLLVVRTSPASLEAQDFQTSGTQEVVPIRRALPKSSNALDILPRCDLV